ncbi:TonB-dependent receptor [Flavipsychrobacter stenotrophus]|nr:TonB-dependent receptor [Flavipsychrobacter stenotrophus]
MTYQRSIGTTVRYMFTLVFIFSSIIASAQKFTVSGTIKDKKSGEALIGATLVVVNDPTIGVVTNEYGYYSLTLPKGDYKLLFRYVSYNMQEIPVTLDKNTKLDIIAEPEDRQLKEVVVSSKLSNVRNAQMGMTKLNVQEMKALPVLFGERDVMKIVQLLPGVESAGDGNSGFYVRGGAVDQNLILLDEAIVYNPSHLLGFFSTFNSDALKDVTLYKGTAPAQFGGRLSSVMDVKMNDGNDKEYHVSGGIGLISSKLAVEGPIVKDKGSFLISGRRTYADIFLGLSPDTNINRSRLYFYDLNTKFNYKLSDKDRLFLSGYFGKDQLGLGSVFGINWGNATGTLRWNHLISPKLFSNTSLIFSDYNYNINVNNSGFSAKIHSEIRDWNLKEELDYFSNPKNTIRVGFSSIYHTITPGTITGANITTVGKPDNHTWENGIYISNAWKPNSRWNIDYGIRLSIFTVFGGSEMYELDAKGAIKDTLKYGKSDVVKNYINPEPRFSASYTLNENSSLKAAYTRNTQSLHLISNSTSSNPTDKWVATNNIIKPEIADLGSLGYFRNFKNNMYELSVEGYYKYSQNQIDYKDGANVLNNDAIEPKLLFGQGRAYGLEFSAHKTQGKFTGWISYTLSKTETQINGINNNQWYNARQDRTHNLSVVAVYEVNKKWTLSSSFVYYTGDAVSFPSGKYNINNQTVFYYTERNGYRMPSYNRLDFGATRQLAHRKHFTSEISFSVYNAYGQQNPYIITFQDDPNDASKTQALQTALFRFVPSVSYNFKF